MSVISPVINPGSWGAAITKTISGGITTLSGPGSYKIDTEGLAATDDLDRINGLAEGDEVVLRAANDARTVVIKDGTYIKLGADFSLNNQYDSITLLCIGSNVCISKGGMISAG